MHSAILILLVASCAVFQSSNGFPTRAVFVKVYYGDDNSYVVIPSYSESVQTVKELIAKKIGVPAVDQRLSFLNEELASGKTLADYGVGDKTNPIIFVTKAQENESPKVGGLTIFQGKSSYYIDIANDYSTTIAQVKETISKKTGILLKDIVLEFTGTAMVEDSYRLSDYQVNKKAIPVLFVSRPRYDGQESVRVKVYTGNKFFELLAGLVENIGAFKEEIRSKLQKAMDISLSFNNSEIMRDSGTIADYGIADVENPVILASFNIDDPETAGLVLTVHHGEKRFQFITASAEKIIDAKKTIERVAGIPVIDQSLSFIFDEMQNEKTMKEHGISAGANQVVYLSKNAPE